MCPFISSITTSDMPIHIPSKYHHFILRDTTYQMKYLIPKTQSTALTGKKFWQTMHTKIIFKVRAKSEAG